MKSGAELGGLPLVVQRVDACPLSAEAPFCPPRLRAVPKTLQHRIGAWLSELLPHSPVRLSKVTEWVSPDHRTDVHAVVIDWHDVGPRQLVVFKVAERIGQADLDAALAQRGSEVQQHERRGWVRAAGVRLRGFGAGSAAESADADRGE